MTGSTGDELWYPTVEDVLMVHSDVVAEDEDAEPGVESEERIDYAVDFIQCGHFDEGPETIHEKAFHLMRLLSSNHWFVDGNKRTALNTTELFYLANGYELEYGEDFRSILKLFSVRQALIDREEGVEYLSDRTEPAAFDEAEWYAFFVESPGELVAGPLTPDILRDTLTVFGLTETSEGRTESNTDRKTFRDAYQGENRDGE